MSSAPARRLVLVLVLGACRSPASGASTDASSGRSASPAAVASAPTAPSARAVPSAPARVDVVEASPDVDTVSFIRAKRLEARAARRVLVVYVGASWCEPCKKLRSELASGRLDERLGRVSLLTFDADRDVDRLGAAGYTFTSVPYVALPGADGRPTDSRAAAGKGARAWEELLGKLDAWQDAP